MSARRKFDPIPIDPLVDPVFKALFGTEENKDLLQDFINAVLERIDVPKAVTIELIPPRQLRRRALGKETEVDVRAKDAEGRVFQVEVQLDPGGALAERMIYGAGALYASTLEKGKDYSDLKPVVAIWLLRDRLPRGEDGPALTDYRIRSPDGRALGAYPIIVVIELKKWSQTSIIQDEIERWLYFFSHGKELSLSTELPRQIRSEVFMKAVNEAKRFNDSWTKRMAYMQWEDAVRWRLTKENEWKRRVESDKREIEESKQQLEEGKQQLEEGKHQLEESKQQLEERKHQLEEGKHRLEERERELARKTTELEAEAKTRWEIARKALIDTGLSPEDAARLLGDAPP